MKLEYIYIYISDKIHGDSFIVFKNHIKPLIPVAFYCHNLQKKKKKSRVTNMLEPCAPIRSQKPAHYFP